MGYASSKIQYGMLLRKFSELSTRVFPPGFFLLPLLVLFGTLFVGGPASGQAVDTDPLNRNPAVVEAFQHFYIMDYDGALARFNKIQAEHPSDPIATDYVLYVTLFKELFRLDLLDTTFYANDGFLVGHNPIVEDPKMRDQINALSGKAFDQANTQLEKNANDVNALFARGWARSLEACYLGMVERSYTGSLRLALGARNDHQRVLDLDPNYVDAKMVVGIYQYVVGSLPFTFKLLIGIAGIHGSKATGLAMLQDAGARGVITSVESRTALMLFLRREGRPQEALNIAQGLAKQYPRDFLFALEVANLLNSEGQGAQAIAVSRGIINDAKKPGYFPSVHLELAYFALGDSYRGQKQYAEAAEAYREGAYLPTTSAELKRRCLLAAGEVYDLMNQRDKAVAEYQAVIDAGNDSAQADQARKFQRAAYTGR